MKQRILTALTLLLFTLLGIFILPFAGFVVVMTVIIAVLAWEWSSLSSMMSMGSRAGYVLGVLVIWGIILFLSPWLLCLLIDWGWIYTIFWLVILLAIVWGASKTHLPILPKGLIAILGVVNLPISCFCLLVLSFNKFLFLWFLSIVCLNDTLAYFSGRYWGKHWMVPTISPKKTWEGLWVGLVATLSISTPVVYSIIESFYSLSRSYESIFVLSIATIVAANLGDLLESWLKRSCGLKDSGKCLPGHGGLLDRLDSLLSASSIFLVGSFGLLGFLPTFQYCE